MTKQVRWEEKQLFWLDLSLEEIQRELPDLIEKYGANSTISIEETYGDNYLSLSYTRLETDLEEKTRLKFQEANKAVIEERERKQYEELKKKYGA